MVVMEVAVNVLFSPKQQETIRQDTTGITLEVNEGTIRSGKTTADIFKMANFYIQSGDKNHLVSAYNQEQAFRMFMDGDGLGLIHIFGDNGEVRHDEHGDHLYIYTPNGEKKIYYKGGGKANSVGAITGMSLGSVTFLEINLLNMKFIQEALRRTLAAKDRFHLAELNPPAPSHPIFKEVFERFEKAGTFKWRHWTPYDNPILSQERLDEWYNELKHSKYLLDRDWYGKRVLPQGVIYGGFDQELHTENVLEGKVVEAFYVADGGQDDATTCGFYVVTRITDEEGNYKFRLYRMANYYHSGNETGEIKSMSKYAREIKRFMEWCFERWGFHYSAFFVDPACKSLREELHDIGIDTFKADNNSRDKVGANGMKIEVGIERARNCISKDMFRLLEEKNCEEYDHYHFIKELGMYMRDDGGKPIDEHNHAMDEFRYAVNYFYREYLQ
ncbi:PBSX family phage terminase large subunit [Bacillus cereus]|uniref:PBSX family phage terminase large subunit n=2 Tax=Bacillus cereus TaxID=1396 RepID=A0A9X7BH55_BACCE|nr:PBSX family phage terminase large subunit [Bacillus cereus]PFV11226.1 PBSX family phage terminase large subunit [Bacillus cereus]